MSRPRSNKNKSLPQYLYTYKRNGVIYYAYRHPQTGKLHGMGTDKALAIKAAHQLNAQFLSIEETDLVRKVIGGGKRLDTFIDRYEADQQAVWNSPVTRATRHWQLQVIKQRLGTMAVSDITTQHIADFLSEKSASMANNFRTVLMGIFNAATAQGLIERNPVVITQNRKIKVQRERLSLEQFKAIHACAIDYLQDAMELSLLTLQRREDIVSMQASDIRDGHLHVRQKKTGQQIRIQVNGQLAVLLERCQQNPDFISHIIHSRRNYLDNPPGSPIDVRSISIRFAAAREKAGITGQHLPSFHEIRSLGARLYEKQGVDPQPLLGHKSRRMVEKYLDSRNSEWTETQANLLIPISIDNR